MDKAQVIPKPTDVIVEPQPWQPPQPPTDLIFDDGEPLETKRHRIAMNILIDSAEQALVERQQLDSFVGGNMFVYYSSRQVRGESYRGPDFFAVLGVEQRERQGWVVWEEEGRYPDVIIELLSGSTAKEDKGPKKDIYEQVFRTPDYFIYDPFDPKSLQGWRLQLGQGYQPLQPNDRGWLWSETLGLWVGTWDGVRIREPVSGTCAWLRFYYPDGQLVLLPEEAAEQKAQQAQQDAELEKQKAQQAQQEAQQAQQKAQQAQEKVNLAEALLEEEKLRSQQLADQLRQLGIDPDRL